MAEHICKVCGSVLHCTRCKSTRLRKYGHDYTVNKQRWLCKACGRYITTPDCACLQQTTPERRLSESGRRCLDCGQSLNGCPNCGEQMITASPRVTVRWTLKDGTKVKRRAYECLFCHKGTTNPGCGCLSSYTTEKARSKVAVRSKESHDETNPVG